MSEVGMSDASEAVKKGVTNLDADARKRIDESLKVEIPLNHKIKTSELTHLGIVHSSENILKQVK